MASQVATDASQVKGQIQPKLENLQWQSNKETDIQAENNTLMKHRPKIKT